MFLIQMLGRHPSSDTGSAPLEAFPLKDGKSPFRENGAKTDKGRLDKSSFSGRP